MGITGVGAPDPELTLRQAASRLGVPASRLRRLAASGDLEAIRRGRTWVVRESGLDRLRGTGTARGSAKVSPRAAGDRADRGRPGPSPGVPAGPADIEARDWFLTSVSHELRTPLNSVLGFAQLLEGEMAGPLTDRQRRYVHHIRSSGDHLLALINDLLDLSKAAAGQMEISREPVRVKEAVEEAVGSLRPMIDAKRLTLSVEVEGDLTVEANRRRMIQILLNLISNAVKFTPSRGTIEVTARRSGGAVDLEVRDTGIGIAPDRQQWVFEEFTQIDSEASDGGTGLGLALSRRLAERLGGELRVSSRLGEGSAFLLTLPALAEVSPSAGE